MRHFGIALILVISLAACNMTMEKPAAEPLNNETVALSPQQSITVQSPPAQQPQTSEQSESDAVSQDAAPQSAAPQSAAPQKPVVQNSAPQNAAPPVSAPQNAAAVLPPCSVRTDWQIYTVVSGDTLGQIAQRTGTDANTLAAANCLKDANSISVGQALRVPSLPAPAAVPTTGRRPNLRNVGDFHGTPDLEGCWAANHGTDPVVFDRIDGSPIGWIGTRVHVLSATPTWVEVYVIGTMSIPDTTGWVRVSDVRLLGLCTEETGVQLDSYRGLLFGNPAGVPDGVCAVVSHISSLAIVYDQPKPLGSMMGTMQGWAKWVSTEGDYYQFEETGDRGDGQGIKTWPGWISTSDARLVNC